MNVFAIIHFVSGVEIILNELGILAEMDLPENDTIRHQDRKNLHEITSL